MEYRVLPHTGLKVSRLSFGTMTFGSQADEAESRRMVDACLNAGINFFDTANMYNQGLAETILGKALGPRRKDVILATKVRSKMGEAPDDVVKQAGSQVEDMLRKTSLRDENGNGGGEEGQGNGACELAVGHRASPGMSKRRAFPATWREPARVLRSG